jgi:hypothetical protein
MTAALASACDGLSDPAYEPTPPGPRIVGLQYRYALGSYASLDLEGDPPFALEPSNPEVVSIVGLGPDAAALSFVGVGRATLRLEDEISATEWVVEVVAHETFEVAFSDSLPIPLGRLSERALLAGEQRFIVVYLDAHGRQLYGYGLAELSLSPGIERCDAMPRSVELYCLSIEKPGLHVFEVGVGDEQIVLPFRTVSESEIVAIERPQPEQELN